MVGYRLKIPKETLDKHRNVYLTADIFFVNKITFFLSCSRKINYTGVENLNNRKSQTIFEAFVAIYKVYRRRNFIITTTSVDDKFATLKERIEAMPGGPRVNLAAAKEHVPEIERRIRVVKEQVQAIRHSMPFKRIPKPLLAHTVTGAVRMLNFFPTKGGISETLSPKATFDGEHLNMKNHLCSPDTRSIPATTGYP